MVTIQVQMPQDINIIDQQPDQIIHRYLDVYLPFSFKALNTLNGATHAFWKDDFWASVEYFPKTKHLSFLDEAKVVRVLIKVDSIELVK